MTANRVWVSAVVRRLRDPADAGRLEAEVGHFTFATARKPGIVEAANFQDFVARLAAPANAFNFYAAGVRHGTGESVFVFQPHQHQAPTAVGHGFHLDDFKGQ